MAVAIRLARQGAKKRPFYRIVAADKRRARDGRFLEHLGVYDPRAKHVRINHERYNHWLSVGAKPSLTVEQLVKKDAKKQAAAGS